MKKVYILLLVFLGSLSSCDEREIATFSGGNEIYFDKFYMNELSPGTAPADSTVASFFFYPIGTETIEVGLVVNLSGKLPSRDLRYEVRVVEEGTTAVPEEYEFADEAWFHVDSVVDNVLEVQDTFYLRLKKSARLETMESGVRLMLELVPTEDVGVGQYERRRAVVISTVVAAQPEWWDEEVEYNLFGKFSQKKYRLFLDNIDKNVEMGEDLIENEPDRAIKLVMQFKEWLNSQTPPILEEDGTLMTVNI